jgi:hypothetical protein
MKVDEVPELGRAVQPLGVPAQVLAGDLGAGVLAVVRQHRPLVLDQHRVLLVDLGIGRLSPVRHQCMTWPSSHGLP